MRNLIFMLCALTFVFYMVSDGLKARSRVVTLVPDLLYALSEHKWQSLSTGLDYKTAQLKEERVFGTGITKNFTIHLWRFDPKNFNLSVVNQHKLTGSAIKAYRTKANAILAINGGFFAIEKGHNLTASGLVVVDGKTLSPYRKGAGSGLFYERKGEIALGWARQAQNYGVLTQALQVGPMVVDPNGKNGISSNDGHYAKRSVICQDFKGQFLVIIIDGKISLFETGKLLSTSEKQGGIGCERALNLDGGPSTMVDFKHKGRAVYISGRWPVVNALVLTQKAATLLPSTKK